MKAILEPIIAVGVVVGLVLGALAWFAKADDLKLVELRLDQKIVSDQVIQVQQRLWQLEDRHKGKPCAEWQEGSDRDEYRKLQIQVDDLKRKQDQLIKK